MDKVFIVHGFQGSPNGGWRPWLMAELEKRGVYACALAMPYPNRPVLSEWVQEIARHIDTNRRDRIYLVGHSLGVPGILRYLEKICDKDVQGIVLVSGPAFKTTKKAIKEFLDQSFDFETIKSKAKRISVIHGENDRMVSLEQGRFLAEKLGVECVTVKDGGHLNGSSGHLSLPQCLEALERMMK